MKPPTGYTLVELMIVLTIVAILLGLGVPSYRYITDSNRLSAEVNGLLGDLQFARSEAIKEGATVTVCPANAGLTACQAGAVRWDQGWIVTSAAVTPAVMRIQRPFPTTKDSFVSTHNETSVSFDRNGFAAAQPGFTNARAIIKLTTTPNTTQSMRCVLIELGGMLSTARYQQDPDCK
jgi:type IV fimbrial biogenesis protein FimT